MQVAVVQFTPQFHELEANWARITETAEREPADLVVFPELSSCGYRYTRRAEILPYTDTRSALRPLQEIARRSGQLFVGGFAERVGRQLYNSAYVISAQGLRVYRKLHLWNFEKVLFRPGNRLLSFPFGGYRLGVEICYDLQFPEVAVALARAGAEMLIVPMAWAQDRWAPGEGLQPFSHLAIATAYSLGIPVVVANRTGRERGALFPGESSVTDAFGRQKRLGRSEGILRASVDLALARSARRPSPRNDLLGDRRMRVASPRR